MIVKNLKEKKKETKTEPWANSLGFHLNAAHMKHWPSFQTQPTHFSSKWSDHTLPFQGALHEMDPDAES